MSGRPGGCGTGPGMAPASCCRCQLKSSSYPWLCEVIYGHSCFGLRVSASLLGYHEDSCLPLQIGRPMKCTCNRRPWGLLLRVGFMDTLSNYYLECSLSFVHGEHQQLDALVQNKLVSSYR